VLGHWDVLSCVTVHQDALKRSGIELSWRSPHGRAGLFTPGHLALPPSSLEVTHPLRARDEPATLRPIRRLELIVGGA
jgi:hypothetical protein